MRAKEQQLVQECELCIERASAERAEDTLTLIEEYYDAIGVVKRDSPAALLQCLKDSESAIWVAYYGSHPAGCVLLRPLPQLGNAAEIKRLYVRPEYRGRGIASLLLQTLEQFAKERDLRWLYLDTKDDLEEALAFYRRHEYVPCARYNDNPQATIFMRKELPSAVTVRLFQPDDEEAFRTLNESWIEKYFRLEEKDRHILEHPYESILARGGQIFMAVRNGEPVGCCALYPIPDGGFELAKMAVSEHEQGRGIGRKLLQRVIEYAKGHRIARLYLETNSSLTNAIHLYESVGFRHLAPERIQPSVYRRADVYMEMILSEPASAAQ